KLGFESSGFATRADGVYRLGTTHAPMVYFFPSARGGLFFKGGVGYLQYLESVDDDELDEDLDLSGWGVQLGVGYDIRVGNAVSLTPYLMGMMIGSSELGLDGTGTGVESNARLGRSAWRSRSGSPDQRLPRFGGRSRREPARLRAITRVPAPG